MIRTGLWCILLLPTALAPSCSGGRAQRGRVRIGDRLWEVEIAADPQSRRRGLAGRKRVPEGTGMLFVFPREEMLSFHMLDCLVPLDVAFISADGTIVRTRTMPVENDPGNPECVYESGHPVRYVLEVAGGSFARAGVKAGDRVELPAAARDAAKGAR